jgi:hypothetical protein
VQEIEGQGDSFERLRRLLMQPNYDAAAIDAPSSVPAPRIPAGDHRALLAAVKQWDRGGRAFAMGITLVEQLAPERAPLGLKEYRHTEKIWRVNTRSTMWAGSRGGAAMTVACLTLLALAERPMWPWCLSASNGLLAEAFPGAQLKTWNLPHQRYSTSWARRPSGRSGSSPIGQRAMGA